MHYTILILLASLTLSACSPIQTSQRPQQNSDVSDSHEKCHWVKRHKGGKIKRCQVLTALPYSSII